MPIDIDVSPMDNFRTEKKVLVEPIRDSMGSLQFSVTLDMKDICLIVNSSYPYLFRLDGGNDSFDTLKVLIDSSHFFLIKRNKRKESNHYWLDMTRSIGIANTPREGKTVYTGVLTKTHPKATKDTPDMDIVFKITERTITHGGNLLLIPEIEKGNPWAKVFLELHKQFQTI